MTFSAFGSVLTLCYTINHSMHAFLVLNLGSLNYANLFLAHTDLLNAYMQYLFNFFTSTQPRMSQSLSSLLVPTYGTVCNLKAVEYLEYRY